jgi:hypothetical protein
MKLKEFSNKNSLALFYSTILLLIIVIILFFSLAYEGGKGRKPMSMDDYRKREGQMINNGLVGSIDLPSSQGSQASVTVEVKP